MLDTNTTPMPTTWVSPDPNLTGLFGMELIGDQDELELLLDRLATRHGAKMIKFSGGYTAPILSPEWQTSSVKHWIVTFKIPRQQQGS